MITESVSLAGVQCDYVEPDAFYATCRRWLTTKEFHHVVTLNAEMVIEAHKNPTFATAVNEASLRVSEAGPIWAKLYLHGKTPLVLSLLSFAFQRIPRLVGVEMVANLAAIAHKLDRPIYLLGGEKRNAKGTAIFLKESFPGLKVFSSPPHVSSLKGPKEIVEDINKSKSAILFVAYGAPRQSFWIENNKDALPHIRIAIGVGGAYDILSKVLPRAPHRLRHHNLEWLWRLWLEPHRLPRIWRATVVFPLLIRQQKRKTAR